MICLFLYKAYKLLESMDLVCLVYYGASQIDLHFTDDTEVK